MQPVLLACEAMRCRFELLLSGDQPGRLRAAGEEALAEILWLEPRLSCFSPVGQLSRVNREAFARPVAVDPPLFELLRLCRHLWELTGGRFDPTMPPHPGGRVPGEDPADPLGRASLPDQELSPRGMSLVELDSTQRSVRFLGRDVALNLGAVGKGYALDRAALILKEAGIRRGLLHAGTSSVLSLSDGDPWRLALAAPDGRKWLATVELLEDALGVSSNHSRHQVQEGVRHPHVIDPISRKPAPNHLAAVVAATAAEADALSTALLCDPAPCSWIGATRGVLWLKERGGSVSHDSPALGAGPRWILEAPALERRRIA